MKLCIFICVALALAACDRVPDVPAGWVNSSSSVKQAKKRGIFVAEYAVPAGADLGRYQPGEVWVETVPHSPSPTDLCLVVRLKGPHHGSQPRVRVTNLADSDYRSIWSTRNGPPYEEWRVPDPLPDVFTLERDEKRVDVRRRTE